PPPPPRPPLFPYMTLFRSPVVRGQMLDRQHHSAAAGIEFSSPAARPKYASSTTGSRRISAGTPSAITRPKSSTTTLSQTEITRRSEEHTSELQSRFDLVCR